MDEIRTEGQGVEKMFRLKGPAEVEWDEKKTLPQNKRRLYRKLAQMAFWRLKQEESRLRKEHSKTETDMDVLAEMLKDGEAQMKEGNTPDATLKQEERCVQRLNGFRNLCELALGEEFVKEATEKYGDGWQQRLYLTKRQVETEQLDKDGDNETEYEYSIKLYSEEDCGRMHDILTKLMPEEKIPEPVKDPSFIANMEQYTVKQQIPPTMADIFTGSATVSKAFQQNGWRVGTTCESGH